MDDPYKEIRQLLAEYDLEHSIQNGDRLYPYQPLDLLALRDRDFNRDWLVEKFWPDRAHLHIFATPKTGKSLLMLWIAANLALGRDAFTGEPIKRYRVAYVDNEMTEEDLQERLVDMALPFEELEGWLLYFSYPTLPPMDTESGGLETLSMMQHYESSVLILDTLSRVVRGEENSNDTYRNFYAYTGRLLKANSVSLARLDHAGHDPKKSRGASAKADDVDLVYGLERRSGKDESPGYRLARTHARMGGISETIELVLADDPISIKTTALRSWSVQAIHKAKELDDIDAPLGISQREAIRLLRDKGIGPGKTLYLAEALRLRLERAPLKEFGL
jgi:hypothetical protein